MLKTKQQTKGLGLAQVFAHYVGTGFHMFHSCSVIVLWKIMFQKQELCIQVSSSHTHISHPEKTTIPIGNILAVGVPLSIWLCLLLWLMEVSRHHIFSHPNTHLHLGF